MVKKDKQTTIHTLHIKREIEQKDLTKTTNAT